MPLFHEHVDYAVGVLGIVSDATRSIMVRFASATACLAHVTALRGRTHVWLAVYNKAPTI